MSIQGSIVWKFWNMKGQNENNLKFKDQSEKFTGI